MLLLWVQNTIEEPVVVVARSTAGFACRKPQRNCDFQQSATTQANVWCNSTRLDSTQRRIYLLGLVLDMSTANRCADNGWQSVGTIFGFKHCHDELSFQQNQASLEKMRELLANGEKDVMPMINFVAGNMCDMLFEMTSRRVVSFLRARPHQECGK